MCGKSDVTINEAWGAGGCDEGQKSSELAEDDGHDEENEHGDDGNGDYPIGSHPRNRRTRKVSFKALYMVGGWGVSRKSIIKGEGTDLRAMPLRVLTLLST